MTTIPFSYNPSGIEISGCTQVGDLAIGTPITGFTDSPQFWNSPDLGLGYVICLPVPDNSQPTEISGVTASVGFWRSSELTDESFIQITNVATNSSFTGVTECLDELGTLGYWTSYEAPAPPLDPLPPLTDVIAYYKFEDTLNDNSLNGFTLEPFGDVPGFGTEYSPKVGFSKGAIFSGGGVNNYVALQDYLNDDKSYFTWFKSSGSATTGSATSILANGNSVGIFIRSNNLRLISSLGGVFETNMITVSDITFTDDTWYHVGYTVRDTGEITNRYEYKVYVDGVLKGTLLSNIVNVNSSDNLRMFDNNITSSADETIIFKTVLTQEQITDLYTRTEPAYGDL